MPTTCRNCGAEIILADDWSRWLHVKGNGWSLLCGLVAEPLSEPGA